MRKSMHEEIQAELEKRAVVAVLVIDDARDAVPVARALVKGGITAIELALRTEAAPLAIKEIHDNVPEMMIGVGTVIQSGQAKMVKGLGADFAVSPGFNPRILQEAIACDLPFAPGISTASELELAYEQGCDFLKLFPAVPLGGIPYFKAMTGPYNYLGIQFFPLGGVSEATLSEWASLKNIPTIGGSWIATSDLIKEKNYAEITRRAEQAITIWRKAKRGIK
ncbi:MAG: bifunctional 4-hydroxy-2-oxoglutarate aldolase/2-dehydro-3-deoxy-phosphogluconate aldolase [Sphaerochaeta sp.]|nr:bifunctional 4-hydroxy-2-oxoglutarate aldolase/2-dehydro-3-deoxy-phosphogluconate aldolase [Sphaerochaeta sp.]